ncbi:MAG: phosphate uptake regulator PhoU, partial [Candidatus Caldarchaeum sp.]|nr:phosphate uptake regulator PhoU [Candidatus Caldarchaeum sp.]
MEAYTRRIQKTGKSTYVVSLPKKWVEANKLGKLDPVKLMVVEGMVLVVPEKAREALEAEVKVSEDDSPRNVVRLIFSKYLAGFSRIRVSFSTYSPQTISYLKEVIRRWLVGVEIIEESATELVAQCLPMHDRLPVKTSMERMGGIAANMVRDAVAALASVDTGLAEEVIRRDDEVDRFYHFVIRQLNIAVKDYSTLRSLELSDPSDCISYVLVAKSIERAADHAVSICRNAKTVQQPLPESQTVVNLTGEIVSLFRKSLHSLLNTNLELAGRTLTEVEEAVGKIEHLTQHPHRGWSETHYLLVLGSLKRIV